MIYLNFIFDKLFFHLQMTYSAFWSETVIISSMQFKFIVIFQLTDYHIIFNEIFKIIFAQVLIDNGFKPEWITLQKEITNESEDIRRQLRHMRSYYGRLPLNEEDKLNWDHSLLSIHDTVKELNKKISEYFTFKKNIYNLETLFNGKVLSLRQCY